MKDLDIFRAALSPRALQRSLHFCEASYLIVVLDHNVVGIEDTWQDVLDNKKGVIDT